MPVLIGALRLTAACLSSRPAVRCTGPAVG